MRRSSLAFAASIVLCATACKQPTGSSVDSLDNFARRDGASVRNECSGQFPLSASVRLYSDAVDRSVLQSFANAMKAIPSRLQQQFFEADRGAVVATAGYARACESHLRRAPETERRYLSEGKGAISGCVDKRDDVKVATIRIAPTVIAAEHELVRMFGLLYAQIYGPRTFSNWTRASEALATKFLQDVANNPRLSVAPYEDLLASEEGYRRFTDFVFAEAFDSFYCNSKTRKIFAQEFPKTYQTFVELSAMLESR